MADVTLRGKLPGGDSNGLAKIAGSLVKNPHKVHAVIALVDSSKTITDNDTGDAVPVVRIRRIEVILPKDLGQAEKLLRRALEERTGQITLDMELEDELEQAFKDIQIDVEEE